MELKEQVCTLDQGMQLRDLGVRQDTAFRWLSNYDFPDKEVRRRDKMNAKGFVAILLFLSLLSGCENNCGGHVLPADSSRITTQAYRYKGVDSISPSGPAEFHVRVDCYCTSKDCGVPNWCIRVTNDNWKTEESVMTSFYTYEAVMQENLFQTKEDAIAYAREIKSYSDFKKINQAAQTKFEKLQERAKEIDSKEKQSVKIK